MVVPIRMLPLDNSLNLLVDAVPKSITFESVACELPYILTNDATVESLESVKIPDALSAL